ncbi:MAG: MBL fold metallo-hydrolase [Dehalococcoidia bacterium]|nr:MBL fold metallo-hydrolase [Dehalococcoidia bacterium]
MRIKWLGHAAFVITSDNGTRIITDPYTPQGGLSYGRINEMAHIVTVSHTHFDHNNVSAVSGKPEVVRGAVSKEIRGIKIKGIPAFHDAAGGRQRGENTVFTMVVDGVSVCHLGDLGHPLTQEQINEIGKVDVLLIPVGGFYTVEPPVADQICSDLSPRVIIPMHFKTSKTDLPIAGVEEFLRGKSNVKRLAASEVEFKRDGLPVTTQIVVLTPAL